MDLHEQYDFENLLIRYLQNTASEEEYRQLLAIIKNSEAKKEEIFKLKAIYESLSVSVSIKDFPVEKSWKNMLSKINTQEITVSQSKTIKKLIRYCSYAAIFVLGAFLLTLYFRTKTENYITDNYDIRLVTEKNHGRSTLYLNDGTKVILNAGTTLQYPSQFNSKERVVLLDGEGYFEVAKDSNHPFIVKLKEYDVKVLGTIFNINAYSDLPVSTTSLIEGKVELTSYNKNGEVEAKQILLPNETASVDHVTGKITLTKEDEILSVAWLDGLYKFKDKTFATIVSELEKIYHVEIEIMNENLANAVFTGSFDIENSIDEVLQPLARFNSFKYTKEKNLIKIYSLNNDE